MRELFEPWVDALKSLPFFGALMIALNVLGIVVALVIPFVRPLLARRSPLFQDARRTALMQLIGHGAVLTAIICFGKAVCVERVFGGPMGTMRASGDLLSDGLLCAIAAAWLLLDGIALWLRRAPWTNRLGGLLEAIAIGPVFAGACFEMSMSLQCMIPFFFDGMALGLLLGVPLCLVEWTIVSLVFRWVAGPPKERKAQQRLGETAASAH